MEESKNMKRYIACIKTRKTYDEYTFITCEAEDEDIARGGMLIHAKEYGLAPENIIQISTTKRPRYNVDMIKVADKQEDDGEYKEIVEIASELYGDEVFVNGFLSGIDGAAMDDIKNLINKTLDENNGDDDS